MSERKKRELTALFFVLFMFVSCGQKKSETKQETAESTGDVTQQRQDAGNTDEQWWTKVKIKRENGDLFAEIKSNESEVRIEFGNRKLSGRKENDKRKYRFDDEEQIACVVTCKPERIKIKSPEGQLLWKIKLKDGKVDVLRQEEGGADFTFKLKDDKIKVRAGEKTLGKVKLYPERKKVKIKDAAENVRFKINAETLSAGYGALLLDDVSVEEQLVMVAEIMSAGM
jgi:hypothetical protein